MRNAVGENAAFAHRGYQVLRQILPEPVRAFLYEYALKSARTGRLDEGDKDVPNAPCRYGDPLMESLLKALLPRVSGETGLDLYPTYSYFRVYQHGAVLNAHRDRPACEISVTINVGLEAERPWPIGIETDGKPAAIVLEPGDALLYKGIDVPHWRDAFTGARAVQVFLHYVDQKGPHAERKFDGRLALGTSAAAERTIETLMGHPRRE